MFCERDRSLKRDKEQKFGNSFHFRSGCRLTWGACKDDGGLPVEYVVDKFVAAADAWSKAGQVSGTAFEVNDLEVGREYAFAVRAINSEGESDALPTPKTIIAKDAYSK